MYEGEIRRRWRNKSRSKRKSLLQKIWPQIPLTHQPGFGARDPVTGAPKDDLTTTHATIGTDSRLWPNLNLVDLSLYEPLLLLLNSRSRHHPRIFVVADFRSASFGGLHRQTRNGHVEGYYLSFLDKNEYAIVCSNSAHTEEQTLDLEVPPDLRGLRLNPGEGGTILAVQRWLYTFLVAVVREILPDKRTDLETLSHASTPIAPEPPSLSANSNETGITHLAITVLEAPYCAPGTMNLDYMRSLVSSMRRQAQDHLSALRDNPVYFSNTLLD